MSEISAMLKPFREKALRTTVAAAYVLGLLLFFVPEESGYSELERTRVLLSGYDTATGLWLLAGLGARIGFLVLVLVRPRRWVYMAGAVWAALVILRNILLIDTGWGPVLSILSYGQLVMRMTGFFAGPNREAPRE